MTLQLGLGLLIGLIMALTGAGGGILAVPLLVFGAQLSVAEAGPVGLAAVGIAAALGAALGLKAGIVRYRAALLMAGTGVLLSPLGILLARRVDNRWLSLLFALVLLAVAYRTFRQAQQTLPASGENHDLALPCVQNKDSGRFVWTSRCAGALAASGAVAGMLSGLLGVGGGFVLVPVLRRFSDLAAQSIIATSLAVIALVSGSAVLFSAASGNLNWNIALPFSAGALAGMAGGRLIASRLPASGLQKGFAGVAAIVAVGMLVKSLA